MSSVFSNIGAKISNKVKIKAQKLYEKASPKVQKEIQKIISTKTTDMLAVGAKVISYSLIIFLILKVLNSPSEAIEEAGEFVREINTYYNRVNITHNYYLKGE